MNEVVEFAGVSKAYGGLRPFRLERLLVGCEDRIAIVGLDRAAAEVFVNLVTGASLPDAGEVRVFGRPTASIADSTEWLQMVDRFGIVSDRAVLLDALTVLQNLCMPFTLAIEPPDAAVQDRALELAREVGIPGPLLEKRLGDLDPTSRQLVQLGRALAEDPALLLVEHATATVPRADVAALGTRILTIAEQRRMALVVATADEEFARAAARRVLFLRPATGRLAGVEGLWPWKR
jgi:ABC-type lipoprotein export system ATPase subunit